MSLPSLRRLHHLVLVHEVLSSVCLWLLRGRCFPTALAVIGGESVNRLIPQCVLVGPSSSWAFLLRWRRTACSALPSALNTLSVRRLSFGCGFPGLLLAGSSHRSSLAGLLGQFPPGFFSVQSSSYLCSRRTAWLDQTALGSQTFCVFYLVPHSFWALRPAVEGPGPGVGLGCPPEEPFCACRTRLGTSPHWPFSPCSPRPLVGLLNIFIFYFSEVFFNFIWIVLFSRFSASMIQLCAGCAPFACHLPLQFFSSSL